MATTSIINVFTLTPCEVESKLRMIENMKAARELGTNPNGEGCEETPILLGNLLGIAYNSWLYPFDEALTGPFTANRIAQMYSVTLEEQGLPENFEINFENVDEAIARHEEQTYGDSFLPNDEDGVFCEPPHKFTREEDIAFISGVKIGHVEEMTRRLAEELINCKIHEDLPVNEDVVDGAGLSCTIGSSEDLAENREGIYVPIKRRKLFHFSAKADVPKEAVEVASNIIGKRQMSVTSEMAGIDQQEEIGRQAVSVQLNDEFSRLGPDCTIENICDRFYPLDSFTWSSTDVVFALKYNKGIVETLLGTNLPFVGILRHHLNLIASFDIEIRYNAYPQALGMMLVGYYPSECASLVPNAGNDTFTLLPHSKLSAGYETVQELKAKLFMETNYLQLSTVAIIQRHDIRLVAMVWNQLVVAAGMPNQLTAHIWIKPKLNSATKTTYRTVVGDRQSKGKASEHESTLNTVLNGVASVAGGVLDAIPVVSTVVKAISGIVGLFDKPSVYLEEASIGLTDVPIRVNTSRQVKDQSGQFEGVMEPVTLMKYLQTPCRIRTTPWTAAAATDTLLFSQEVSLQALPAYNPVAEVSKGYTLWRGTLCYAFEIVGTRFHQGQLMVSVTYRNSHSTVPTNLEARETYMFTVDIGTNNYFCVEIPHVYPHDWRSVRNETTQYTTPILTVWVQNPLAAPSIVGNVVYVNTYFSVGDDFEFNGQKHKAEQTTEEAAWAVNRVIRCVYEAGEGDNEMYKKYWGDGTRGVEDTANAMFEHAMAQWEINERDRRARVDRLVEGGHDRSEAEAANPATARPLLRFFNARAREIKESNRRCALSHVKEAHLGIRQSMGAAGETHAQTGQKTCWSPFQHNSGARLGGNITHIETNRRRGISVLDLTVSFATSARVRIAILPLYPTNIGAALGTADRFYNVVTAGFRTGCGRWVVRTNINKMQSIRFATQNRYLNDPASRDGSFIPVDDPFFTLRAENGITETVVNSEGFINIEVPMVSNNPIMALNGNYALNRVMSVALYALASPGSSSFNLSLIYIPGDDERFYFMLPMIPGAFSVADRTEISEDVETRETITRRNPVPVASNTFIRGNVRHVHVEMYGDGVPRVSMDSEVGTNSYGLTDKEAAELPQGVVPHIATGVGIWQSIGSRQMEVKRQRISSSCGEGCVCETFGDYTLHQADQQSTEEGDDESSEADGILTDSGNFFNALDEQYQEDEILYGIGTLFGNEIFRNMDYVGKTHIRNVYAESNRRRWRDVFRQLDQYGTLSDFLICEFDEESIQGRFWWTVEYYRINRYHAFSELAVGKQQLGDRWFDMIKEALTSFKLAMPELKRLGPFVTKLERLGENVEKWTKNLWKAVKLVLDNVFPIVTALYTAFTAPVALSAIAVTQLCYHLYNLIPEGKEQDPDTCLHVDESHFGEKKDGERQMGLADFMLGGVDVVDAGLESLVKVISQFGGGLVAAVSRTFGYAVGPGYAKYMRRRKEEVGTETLFERCVRIFFDSVLYALYGNSMNIEWERKRILAVTEVVQKFQADELCGRFVGAQMDAVSVDGTHTNLERLRWYYKQAKDAMFLEAECRLSPLVSRQIQKIYDTLMQCERVKRTKTMQPEPVGVYFGGKPGTGKSLLVSNYLPRFLLSECDLPCGDACMYTIPTGEQEFWDNYNQQPYAYVDEFLQENKGADALKVVQMISSSKWAINMASLDAKGMSFESRFIAASSNLTSVITATEIADQSALVRRFPFAYELRIQEQYDKNGKVDYSKLINAVDRCLNKKDFFDLMDSVWHFHRLDLLTGKFEQKRNQDLPPLVFSTVLNLLKDEYVLRTTAFASMEQKITDIIAQRQMMRSWWKRPGPLVSVAHEVANEARSDRVRAFIELGAEDEICSNNHIPIIKQELAVLCSNWRDEGRTNEDFYRKVALEWVGDITGPPNLDEWVEKNGAPDEDNWEAFQAMVMSKKVVENRKFPKWIGILGCLSVLGLSATSVFLVVRNLRGLLYGVQGVIQSYTGTHVSRTSRLAKQVEKNGKAKHLQMGDGSVKEKVRRNMRLFRSMWEEEGARCTANVYGLWIDDRHCIIPAHFIDNHMRCKKEEKSLGVEMLHAARGEALSWETVVIHDNSFLSIEAGDYKDAYLYRSPVPVESVRNVLPLIMSEKSKTLDTARNGELLCGGEACVSCSGDIECAIGTYDNVSFRDEVNRVQTVRTAVAKLESRTIDGDCGRPYVLNASFNTPIVGIHSIYCANGIAGMCIITKESVEAARTKFQEHYNSVTLEAEEIDIVVGDRNSRFWNSSTELIGKVTINGHKVVHNSPSSTSLVPLHYRGRRLEHEDWNADFLPAAQRIITTPEGVKVHPLITNAQKYDVKFQTLHGDRAMGECIINFVNKIPDRFSRILTVDEAINGTADGSLMPLKMDTSCGYWGEWFKDGKKQIFEEDEYEAGEKKRWRLSQRAHDCVVPLWNCSFVDRLSECRTMLANKIVPAHLWIATTKDELRPREKVLAGKTRVFEQPGLEYVLLSRQYFGEFLGWYKDHAGFTLYHGIGEDKEVVWGAYLKGFAECGAQGHAFDYSNWDGSVPPQAFEFFLEVTDHFYRSGTAEARNVRHGLVRMLRDGLHVMNDQCYRTKQGNKSGNPFTDVFNSVCNTWVMYSAWMMTKAEAGLEPTLTDFDDKVRMLTYGDDLMMTVRPDALQFFTGPAIERACVKLGLKITDAKKTGVIPDFVSFKEMSFLKSEFNVVKTRFGSIVLAPMPEADILKELTHCPKSVQGNDEDLRQRISNTQRFMAHHGAAKLERFQQQLRDLGLPKAWINLTWDAFASEVKEKQLNASIY
nr:MAG: polyprotein [Wufeng shrew picornavirus 2]